MPTLHEGQVVYLAPGVNKCRQNPSLVEGTVTKVGRKYITIVAGGIREYKFHKDSLKQVTIYTPDYYIYPSKEEYERRVEFEKLLIYFKDLFNPFVPSPGTSLDKLRRMKAIMEEKEDERDS